MEEQKTSINDGQQVRITWTSTCSYEKTFTYAELREALGDDEDLAPGDDPLDLDSLLGYCYGDIDSFLADEEDNDGFCSVDDRSVDTVEIVPAAAAATSTVAAPA